MMGQVALNVCVVIDCKEIRRNRRGLFELLSYYLRRESIENQKTSEYLASWQKIRPELPQYEITDPAEPSVHDGRLNIAIPLVSRMTWRLMESNHHIYMGFKHHVFYFFFHSFTVHLDIIKSFIYPTDAQLDCSKRM